MEAREYADKLQQIAGASAIDDAARNALNTLSSYILNEVKPNTPVGIYTNKVGGTLRRSWTSTGAQKSGTRYEATISNNISYAQFVENGHRTRQGTGKAAKYKPKAGGKKWVEGRFMLRDTVEHAEAKVDEIVLNSFLRKLNEVLG